MVFKLHFDEDSIDFRALEDDEILELVKMDYPYALEYLIYKYRNFVRSKSRPYFLMGADNDDIVQEGMIGLYKAIRDYDKTKLASFKSFAEICIKRQIITAVKTATRQKHIPLNSYVSLNKPIYEDDSERTLIDVVVQEKCTDPMEIFIGREDFGIIESNMGRLLSEFEKHVIKLYVEGHTYQEIAFQLKRDIKSIDNAIQRIKRKLERYLTVRE